jgi:hypothetical protein
MARLGSAEPASQLPISGIDPAPGFVIHLFMNGVLPLCSWLFGSTGHQRTVIITQQSFSLVVAIPE